MNDALILDKKTVTTYSLVVNLVHPFEANFQGRHFPKRAYTAVSQSQRTCTTKVGMWCMVTYSVPAL